MQIYLNRSRHLAQAPAYSLRLQIDPVAQEVGVLIATRLRQTESQSAAFAIDGVDYFELARTVIRTRKLRASRGWSDRQVFACSYEWKLGRWLSPLPQHVYTLPFRFTAFEINQMYRLGTENSLVALNVPFADSAFEDCFLTVNLHPTLGGLVVDGAPTSDILNLGYDSHEVTRETVFPSVQVKAPDAARVGEPIVFTLQVVDAQGNSLAHCAEVHLEAVNGYCPKPRVRAHQGVAQARVLPLGLDAGDTVRLKAGFKFFPALGDAQVVLTQ
jgi:hypothetical protein